MSETFSLDFQSTAVLQNWDVIAITTANF